jgi:hypothetical protein
VKSLLDPYTEERALLLLRPFARTSGGSAGEIEQAAEAVDCSGLSWDDVISAAEAQGLSGLLYYHCRRNAVDLPHGVRRTLKGLYLRQRRSVEIKADTLGKIVTSFEGDGIDLFILKGVALSHIVYPEPGLRPSSDIDLYVPSMQIDRAREALSELGFQWQDGGNSPGKAFEEKHLPPATLFVDGDAVKIDLHHHLLKKGRPNRIAHPCPTAAPIVFSVGDGELAARTLGIEDTLRYLSLHFCDLGHEPISPVSGNTRLIWAVDIIAFAARFADDVDWESLARRFPWVIGTLDLLRFFLPFPRALESRLPSPVGARPEGVGRGYLGWPGTAFAGRKWRQRSTLLRETFFPPEWWLRLYYGLGISRRVYYHRLVGHPAHIAGHVGRLAARRLRLLAG